MLALAHPDVVDLVEQPTVVRFQRDDGSWSEHVFDLLLFMRNGSRVAVDVKPKSKVESSGIVEVQRLIAKQVGKEFADLYVIRTEDHMHPDDVANAESVLRARRMPDAEADAAVSLLVEGLHGWCRLGDVVEASGLGGSGYNAAVRLIGDGVLEVREDRRISYECQVRRTRA